MAMGGGGKHLTPRLLRSTTCFFDVRPVSSPATLALHYSSTRTPSMTLRRFFNSAFLLLALSLLPIPSVAQWTAPNPVVDFQKQSDGVLIHHKTGTLRLQVCTPAI